MSNLSQIEFDGDRIEVTLYDEDKIVVEPGPRHVRSDRIPPNSCVIEFYVEFVESHTAHWTMVKTYTERAKELIAWIDENLSGPYSVEPTGVVAWSISFALDEDAIAFNVKVDGIQL